MPGQDTGIRSAFPVDLLGGEDDVASGLQLDHVARPARRLAASGPAGRRAGRPRFSASSRRRSRATCDRLRVTVAVRVGEIEPQHVGAGGDQLSQRLLVPAGRTDRGDDLRSACGPIAHRDCLPSLPRTDHWSESHGSHAPSATYSCNRHMAWLETHIPDPRQRVVSLACLLIFALTVAVAALTSRASDWQPIDVVLVLLAFSVASELMELRHDSPAHVSWIITSSAPTVLAVTLAGPAPGLAIGAASLLVDAARRRPPIPWVCSNFANYGVFLVIGGLLARWISDALELSPDDVGFAVVGPIYLFLPGRAQLRQQRRYRLVFLPRPGGRSVQTRAQIHARSRGAALVSDRRHRLRVRRNRHRSAWASGDCPAHIPVPRLQPGPLPGTGQCPAAPCRRAGRDARGAQAAGRPALRALGEPRAPGRTGPSGRGGGEAPTRRGTARRGIAGASCRPSGTCPGR